MPPLPSLAIHYGKIQNSLRPLFVYTLPLYPQKLASLQPVKIYANSNAHKRCTVGYSGTLFYPICSKYHHTICLFGMSNLAHRSALVALFSIALPPIHIALLPSYPYQ